MKSLVITGKESFDITETPVPVPKPDEVLIELTGNTICSQHDLAVFSGSYSTEYPLEAGFPGHEGIGIVREKGKKVKGIKAGDAVVMTGMGGPPLYSQFVIRRQGTFFKVTPPAGYAMDSLAALELYGCVYHALEKIKSYRGKTVGVAGLGAAGLAAIQLLKARGPKSIAGLDIQKDRFERAKRCGADSFVDATKFTALLDLMRNSLSGQQQRISRAELERLLPERQFDILIECTGNAISTAVSFALAREQVVVFGYTYDVIPVFQHLWFDAELVIRNSKILTNDDFAAIARLFNRGKIDPAQLVTHRMKFSEYAGALDLVRSGKALKVALAWS